MSATLKNYKALPPLAGICTLEAASRPGLSVEQCVSRLKRYHYALKRLHGIFVSRLTAEPIYELKMAFGLHAHICAEHVATLARRVGEMREPPLGLDMVPHAHLELFFHEIQAAPTTESLLLGLYGKALPAVRASLEAHLRDTNPLVDHPSVRICRLALLEIEEMVAYGQKALEALIEEADRTQEVAYLTLLDQCLAGAGGLSGTGEVSETNLTPHYSSSPYVYDGVPRRDERFADPYNMGVNAEAFLYDADFAPEPKVLMMYYKRMREIDVPEMMASIITQTPGKSWEYYRDMTRQLWDEARHAMMGEVGFTSLGIDWQQVPLNFTWSLGLNTQLTPIERHGVLYFIERGLMPNSGKRFEWETAVASQNALSAVIQDYDWADEVLHANIGRDWYVSEFPTTNTAIKYGDEAWTRVLAEWVSWKEQGLTQHANWWPAVYRQYCAANNKPVDPMVEAFSITYENQRADLKSVSGSA